MWEMLLLLLPRHYSPREIEFHRQRVLQTFRHVNDKFTLKDVESRLCYSLDILRKTDPTSWKLVDAQRRLVSKNDGRRHH